jgi:uncharacterized protein (TIGR02996 family)
VTAEQAALLRAVASDPADDAPRLVYADWLDEHGNSDPASLIRRMVAAPTYAFSWKRSGRPPKTRYQHSEPVRLIRGLRTRLTALCEAGWPEIPDVIRVNLHHGIIEAAALPTDEFFRAGSWLFGAHPINSVDLTDRTLVWVSRGRMTGDWVAILANRAACDSRQDFWPVELFPGQSPGAWLTFPNLVFGLAHLSRAAVAFGRRTIGLTVTETTPAE